MNNYLSLSAAAAIAGRHPSTMRSQIRRRNLVASKPTGMHTWSVRSDHLAAFLAGTSVAADPAADIAKLKELLSSRRDAAGRSRPAHAPEDREPSTTEGLEADDER